MNVLPPGTANTSSTDTTSTSRTATPGARQRFTDDGRPITYEVKYYPNGSRYEVRVIGVVSGLPRPPARLRRLTGERLQQLVYRATWSAIAGKGSGSFRRKVRTYVYLS